MELRADRAVAADAAFIYDLLSAAGARMAEQGFANWTTPYPLERIREDIADGVMWTVTARHDSGLSSRVVATFSLRSEAVHEYEPTPWSEPERRGCYLNRLAVDPTVQAAGIGAWCLAKIAELAASSGAGAVRCDVLAANQRLCAFYERAGYHPRGTRSHSGWSFACYELLLE